LVLIVRIYHDAGQQSIKNAQCCYSVAVVLVVVGGITFEASNSVIQGHSFIAAASWHRKPASASTSRGN